MKKNISINSLFVMILSVLFYSTSLQAQSQFEGKVIIEISSDGDTFEMDYYIKGEKMKMIMKGDNSGLGGMIMTGNKSIVLMDEQKMYMEFDNETLTKLSGIFGGNNDEDDNSSSDETDFSKYRTGKTKTILGYDCEQWIFEEDGMKSEAWVTDEIGSFQIFKSPMGASYTPSWGKSLNNKGFYPLLVTSSDEDGEVSKFEVKSVDKSSLSESDFAPPSGYKKMSIPGF
ncbi:MAG: DUF4412 domain-containing protein [Melioribacteraceae bacterium]